MNIKKKKNNILYNFNKEEKKIYNFWEKKGYFKIKNINNKNYKNNFCIVIPPPNITGNLHLGHSLQQTIIDITARYNRMKGKNVLLKFGTDHAGIATQLMILKKTNFKNKKNNYSNNYLIKKTWLWKKKNVNIINNQIKRLGISVDLNNEIFTMDNNFSKAVKKVFIKLYKKKIIYKKKKLVNWDVKLNTVISDLEIKYKIIKSYLYYLKYPLKEKNKILNNYSYIIIATTRPETIFGDIAIAVNPKDKRYNKLIGKKVIIPLINRSIPIISDNSIEINKGTGCVKISPGHDFNDYKIAKKNNLDIINIFTYNGKIRKKIEIIKSNKKCNNYLNSIPKKFQNLNRFKARKKIILDLKKLGFLNKIEKCKMNIPYSDRGKVIIEPMLTNQWFLKSNYLTKNVIDAIKKKKIIFLQKKYKNMFFGWIKNIQDWCISRQLWWGHRIPAWYDNNKNIYVGNNEKEIRIKYMIKKNTILKQDNDVLDTWFSSSLWTFVSLGWPKKNKELLNFHPINIIFSGFDIIFFWITRMIMLTMYFINDKLGNPQIPFKFIYITGLICDIKGKKMSKSENNTIDPIDIIEGINLKNIIKKRLKNNFFKKKNYEIIKFTKKQFSNNIKPYGSDVLRLFLSNLSNTKRNIILDFKKLDKCKNFCNKLLNAFKFILTYKNNYNYDYNYNLKNENINFFLIDRYIQIKLNIIIKKYCNLLDNYCFNIAINILYNFFWNEFCDWYLEFSKIFFKYGNKFEKYSNYYTLLYIYEKILILLHPIIPFITEYIWKKIKKIKNDLKDSIMLKSFPKYNNIIYNKKDLEDIEWIKKIISSVRNIRSKMLIKYNKKINIIFWNINKNIKKRINKNKKIIKKIANIKKIKILSKNQKKPICLIKLIDGNELLFPLKFINKNIEIKRIKKEIKKINCNILKIKKKINNINFLKYAPKLIIYNNINELLNLNINKKKLIKQLIIFK
ncbi:valine--tRNA ligase [Enterobacterales bacterium endosymbiont of Anomoneura mori]|uniref:valine--tRNA ligase n=1 Tax=Enterobacterales bacterium endosymbiont of Anomoneura mori TaxID=3132096 RepID=UPI00399CED08